VVAVRKIEQRRLDEQVKWLVTVLSAAQTTAAALSMV
jgi:hypothetical protein